MSLLFAYFVTHQMEFELRMDRMIILKEERYFQNYGRFDLIVDVCAYLDIHHLNLWRHTLSTRERLQYNMQVYRILH